jgi:prepilin-type N-terminal cleavage/methylation domain-containing protein
MQTRKRHGFTLVEMLIGLAIMGILLTALATAFDATFMGHEENRKLSSAMQVTRSVVEMITRQARTASDVGFASHDPNDANSPGSGLSELTLWAPADGSNLTSAVYRYNANDHTLIYDPSDGNAVTLLGRTGDGVSVTGFTASLLVDSETAKALTTTVTLNFSVEGQPHKVTASSSQRQNL